nr:MAG TPA: restriction enzyme [Caudoviricetes sp.]
MVPPIKKTLKKVTVKKSGRPKQRTGKKRKHKEYGTSKLERKFAKEFLDKLGIKYQYQFKAESIGRYFDFYLPEHRVLIEVDGDYYHSYGKLYEDMSPMQKKNRRVDRQKSHWALVNGIPLYRVWEHDINKNKKEVIERLKRICSKAEEDVKIQDNKKKRH